MFYKTVFSTHILRDIFYQKSCRTHFDIAGNLKLNSVLLLQSKKDGGMVSALDYANLEGIYYVLIVGSAISMCYGIVYWCFNVSKKARFYDVNIPQPNYLKNI